MKALIFLVLLLTLFAAPLRSVAETTNTTTITLSWDPPVETNIAGYFVYYGFDGINFTNTIRVGYVTNFLILNVPIGVTYYFTLESYDTLGHFSPPSNIAACLSRPQSNTCVVVPPGAISWWTGDRTAGDYFYRNPAKLLGNVKVVGVGKVNNCFSFDGNSGRVSVNNSASLNPANFSIEAWVFFNSLDSSGNAYAGEQYIVFKQNNQLNNIEQFALLKFRDTGGDVFAFKVSGALDATAEVLSTEPIQVATWYHVVATRSDTELNLYVNGILVGTAPVDFAQDSSTNALYFGTTGLQSWDGRFSGLLDEVTLYNRPLMPSEIAVIYSADSAGKCK